MTGSIRKLASARGGQCEGFRIGETTLQQKCTRSRLSSITLNRRKSSPGTRALRTQIRLTWRKAYQERCCLICCVGSFPTNQSGGAERDFTRPQSGMVRRCLERIAHVRGSIISCSAPLPRQAHREPASQTITPRESRRSRSASSTICLIIGREQDHE